MVAKVIERGSVKKSDMAKDGDDEEMGFMIYKEKTSIRVCNHFKYVTIQKILYDETTVSRFMCFGGGVTNVEAEYVRDTF